MALATRAMSSARDTERALFSGQEALYRVVNAAPVGIAAGCAITRLFFDVDADPLSASGRTSDKRCHQRADVEAM